MKKNNLIEYTVNTVLKDFLLEGTNADKAKQKTYEVIKKFFNNADWLNDIFNDEAANPKHLSVINYIEDKFRTDYFGTNLSDAIIRLEPIMMNIALKLGFEQNNPDSEKLNRLKEIITYIKLNYKNEDFPFKPLSKIQIDNTTFESLEKVFGDVIDKENAKDDALANSFSKDAKMNPDYEVIEIHNHDEAKEYGQYSCSRSVLCYITHEDIWDNKFTNHGANKPYLILNKNWKNIPEEYGENHPKDLYGLSMIFLFINPEGNIAFSNTRWNHGTQFRVGNVDHSFTKTEIANLLNVNFDSIFKPYDEEYLRSKGIITPKLAIKMLKQGIPLEEVFDKVGDFKNGFASVRLNNKWSFIDSKGNLIGNGNAWFDDMWDFKDGFARVKLNDKWSFIDTNGNLIDDDNAWFDYVWDFDDKGFALVELNDKKSLINTKGELIGKGKLWFNRIFDFKNGFALVELNSKWSFIDTNGNLIDEGNAWFERANDFKDGFALVRLNNKWSLINSNGNLIGNGKLWFNNIYHFDNANISIIKSDNKYAFINKNGELIGNGKLWFKHVEEVYFGLFCITLKNKYCLVDKDGNLIGNGKLLFDKINIFNKNGFAEAQLNNKWYIIDSKCNFYDYETKEPIPSPINENKLNKIVITEEILMELVKETINNLLKINV